MARASLWILVLVLVSWGSGSVASGQFMALPPAAGNLAGLNIFGAPAAQGAVRVEVAAAPGSFVTLIFATASGSTILAPGLTLQLDLASITGISDRRTVGTSGVVAWTVVLPNGFPAGLTSFIQAGIVLPGGTVHLSNTIQSTTLPSLDLIAPEVLSLTSTSLGGADPAVVTIPSTDSFIIEFSKPIDATTLDLQENLVLVHTGIVTPAQPSGVIVAGSIQGDPTQRIFTLTPLAGLGSTASQVVLTVGGNVVPALAITDIPAPNLAVLPLANFKSVTFTTMAATGVPTPASISETFASPLNIDGSFSPRFAAANLTAGGNGQLSGVNITGSAVPGAAPGSRSQVTITPQGTPNFLNPSTLLNFFSPFDDSGLNNFGPAVNPMGGSRLQLMYLANGMELPSGLASSVELLEWSPGGGMVNPGIYNNFSMMMGHTRAQAASPASLGLVTNFDANWDFDNPQNEWIQPATHPSLANPNANQSPVLVVPPQPYLPNQLPTQGAFVPFPSLSLPFDFDHNRTSVGQIGTLVSPNLLVEILIPSPVAVTGNTLVGTNTSSPVPARRLAGASTSSLAIAIDPVIYHARITTVDRHASARTVFYDSGTTNGMVNYHDIIPQIVPRSGGGQSAFIIRVEGANALSSSGAPISPTGMQTYIDRAGLRHLSALTQVSGHRFVRLQVELEADAASNTSPGLEGILIGFDF